MKTDELADTEASTFRTKLSTRSLKQQPPETATALDEVSSHWCLPAVFYTKGT